MLIIFLQIVTAFFLDLRLKSKILPLLIPTLPMYPLANAYMEPLMSINLTEQYLTDPRLHAHLYANLVILAFMLPMILAQIAADLLNHVTLHSLMV